jgi:S1-C subfamily serine protease
MAFLVCLTILPVPESRAGKDVSAARAVDDRQIRSRFEKELGKLRDQGKTPDPGELQKQLRNRKSHSLDLPPVKRQGGLDTSEVYTRCKESVLCFGHIYKCDNCSRWHGSLAGGFVITPGGVAVTNYHVMENAKAKAFGAMTSDGRIHVVTEVLAASELDDLVIVQLAGTGFSPAGISANAPVGTKAVAISHPQGRFFSVSEGIIARYFKHKLKDGGGETERVAITADYAKGSSGCPVFGSDGGVIGVVSSTTSLYSEPDKNGAGKGLQMVVKSCIPSAAVLRLLQPEAP